MQFLGRIFVVDPTERLTARTALSLPWLASESAGASPPVSARPRAESSRTPRQTSAPDPDFGVQAKPRVQRVLGKPGVPGGPPGGGKERPVGIVAGREPQRYRPQDVEPESVTSFQASRSADAAEECEESIAETCSDSSIPEDCGTSSHASTPARGSRGGSRT